MFMTMSFADGYSDIKGHWAEEYAQRLINLHIMNGYEDGTFKLGNNITRAEFTKLLVAMRYGNYQTYTDEIYTDVKSGDWYYTYICTAFSEGVADTKEGEEYRPNEKITREEMVVMIVKSLELSGGVAKFSDVGRNHRHYAEINAAVNGGILTGYEDGTFRPDSLATRGETAAMVCRMLDYITSKELTKEPLPVVELTDEEKEMAFDSKEEETVFNIGVNENGEKEKINMTWHAVYSTGITKTGNHMTGLDVISPTWFKIVDNTGKTPYSYEEEFYSDLNLYIADLGNSSYMEDCKEEGYKVWAMFNTEGSPSKTSKFLNSSSARKACIKIIKEKIKKYGLDGINLDFENMYEKDRGKYSQFVKEMAEMCHSIGVVLSVDITKYDSTSSTYSLCYDRGKIAEYADYVILMAYDQNGTWSVTAGSVADLKWTENAVKKTLEEVPPQKLVLGVPFYTRIWNTANGKVINSSAVGMSTAAFRVSQNLAEIKYDAQTGQNYAQWGNNSAAYKVWLEDKTSLKARIDIVNNYGLAGIASWSKGFETSDIWKFIDDNLKR